MAELPRLPVRLPEYRATPVTWLWLAGFVQILVVCAYVIVVLAVCTVIVAYVGAWIILQLLVIITGSTRRR